MRSCRWRLFAHHWSDVALALGIARAQVLNGLRDGRVAAIERIRQSRAIYGDATPVALAIDVWTDAEWIDARAGLTSVEQAQDNGVVAEAGATEAANDALHRDAVAAAQANLADLNQVRAAWNSAMEGL